MTPGKDTSEWKLTWKTVTALFVLAVSALVTSGLLPETHALMKIGGLLLSGASVLGISHSASTYTKGRSQLKSMVAMPPLSQGEDASE